MIRKLAGIAFSDLDGPVVQGYLRFGQLTVLTGANDSGKTRLLQKIETVLNRPERVVDVNVFGTGSPDDIRPLIIAPGDDDCSGDGFAEITPVRDRVELPGLEAEIRVGLSLLGSFSGIEAWTWGRSWAELDGDLQERLQHLPAGVSHDADEPYKVEYLGAASPVLLPVPVSVPVAHDKLLDSTTLAICGLCEALRSLGSSLDELHGDERFADEVSDDWYLEGHYPNGGPVSRLCLLDHDENREDHTLISLIHPAAKLACAAVERIARLLLPEFVREKYRLTISPASPIAIAAGEPAVKIELEFSESSESTLEAFEGRFNITDAASGYMLWLQLALLEAAARTRTLAETLLRALRYVDANRTSEWKELDLDDPDTLAPSEPVDPDLPHLIEAREAIQDVLRRLAAPELRAPEAALAGASPAEPPPETMLPSLPPAGWMSDYQTRLYLIDEPEQRLHPALARRAAGWLAAAMERWGTQALVATHSAAFIDLPGDLRAYELTRDGGWATIAGLEFAAITPRAQFARSMGFDRGEMLSRWNAFLLVDDADLAAVLTEMASDRLHASRIRVLRLGHKDSGSDRFDLAFLAEFTSAPATALLMSATKQSGIHRIDGRRGRDGDDPTSTATGEDRDAHPVLRQIAELERGTNHTIDVITLQIPDVFELLDSDTVQRCAPPTILAPFPGHEQARDVYAQTSENTRVSYRAFLEAQYGVPEDPDLVGRIAHQMHIDQRPLPEPLNDAIWQIERGALDSETGAP